MVKPRTPLMCLERHPIGVPLGHTCYHRFVGSRGDGRGIELNLEPLLADDGVHFAREDVVNGALDLEWLPGDLSQQKGITHLVLGIKS